MFLVRRHYACLPSKIDLHCTDLLESVFTTKTISYSRTNQPSVNKYKEIYPILSAVYISSSWSRLRLWCSHQNKKKKKHFW